MRADETERFVEKKQEAFSMIRGFAVNADIGGGGFLGNVVGDLAANRHALIGNPSARLAAAAVAEGREELIDAAHPVGRKEAQRGAKEKSRLRSKILCAFCASLWPFRS